MEERVKYAIFLAIVILVSFSTSYITILALKPSLQNINVTNNSQQSTNTNSTRNIVHALSYQTSFSLDLNFVTVTSDVPIINLTIVYKYTPINGSAQTEEVNYGNYTPIWNPQEIVSPTSHHYQNYQIPQNMVDVSSTTTSDDILHVQEYGIQPQIQVLDVYGYSL